MRTTAKHLAREVARDSVERALHDREARRHRGVSIAGVAPFQPRAERDLIAAATASAQREAAHNASPAGELLDEICAARTTLRLALMELEAVDRARDRDDGSIGKAADRFVKATRLALPAALDLSLAVEAA